MKLAVLARVIKLAAFSTLALVAAGCSAGVESTGSEGSDLTYVGKTGGTVTQIVEPPSPIPFPPSPATYCPSVSASASAWTSPSTCDFEPGYDSRFVSQTTLANLTRFGCAAPWTYDNGPFTEVFVAACPDTPEVHATFTSSFSITCNDCVPKLPSGEFYVDLGGPSVKPDCPSGCGTTTTTHRGGTTTKGALSN